MYLTYILCLICTRRANAQVRIERVEKEAQVAGLEGRSETRDQLEALLPGLRDAKKRAQHAARHLLKVEPARRRRRRPRCTRGAPAPHPLRAGMPPHAGRVGRPGALLLFLSACLRG